MNKWIAQEQLPLFGFVSESDDSLIDHADTHASPFSRYVVYVDESGDHGMESIDDGYPMFVLSFCVFNKRHYCERVVPYFQKFKFNHFGHDGVVLHESDIRKQKGSFSGLISPVLGQQFMEQLTTIVEKSNFILICCAIDKRRLKKNTAGDNPYHIALGFCLETLHDLMQEKQQVAHKTHIVVECRGKKEDKELELEFRRIGDGNNRLGVNLPFEIVFADKKENAIGLQLADLVSRPIGIQCFKPAQHNRAFEVLKDKFYCKGGRSCVGVEYESYGLKIFPTP